MALGGTIGLWPPSILILIPVGVLIYFDVGYASAATMSIGLLAALIFAVRAWLSLAMTAGRPSGCPLPSGQP